MEIKLFDESEMKEKEELTEEQIKERKEKINKLLDIRGRDLNWNEKMIDIFDDVSISINIEQGLKDYNYLRKQVDSVVLCVKIEDFEYINLEDEDATDRVKEIFKDLVKERLIYESIYA